MKIVDVKDIVPLENGVIIKEFERQQMTDSGLVLPEQQHTGTPVVGEIVACGEKSRFQIGDVVFFRRYSVDELTFLVDGKQQTVLFLTDNEVVAYAKKPETNA